MELVRPRINAILIPSPQFHNCIDFHKALQIRHEVIQTRQLKQSTSFEQPTWRSVMNKKEQEQEKLQMEEFVRGAHSLMFSSTYSSRASSSNPTPPYLYMEGPFVISILQAKMTFYKILNNIIEIISRSYHGTPFHHTSSPKLPLKHSAQRKLIHGVGMETVHTHYQPIHNFHLTSYT